MRSTSRSSLHPCPILLAALATAALLTAGPAAAEPSGWVDPPAKDGAKAASKPEPGAVPRTLSETKPQARSAPPPDAEPAGATRAARTAEAPPRRPKAAEVRRERRIAASRETARPAFSPDEAEADRSGRDHVHHAGAAQRLTADYLSAVSGPGSTMVSAAPRFYGERVRFHGRSMNLSALMLEKSRFARRWPERRYAPMGSMRTRCEDETCTVRTAFDFQAQNPASGARSRGAGELTLTIDFAQGRGRIVSETSRVLRYGGPLLGAAERSDRDG